MKKIIFTLLVLFPTMTYAQDKNDCVDAVTAHKGMEEQYGEKPFVDLNEKGVRQLIIYANMATGTWTVFAFNPQQNQLCAITAGKDFKPAESRFDPKL